MHLPVEYDKLDWEQRRVVREKYIKKQLGLCCHCFEPLHDVPWGIMKDFPVKEKLFPRGFFKYPVHLHHSHVTGMTIGAVHCYCNAVLWEYHEE